jgi:hypothetical protein
VEGEAKTKLSLFRKKPNEIFFRKHNTLFSEYAADRWKPLATLFACHSQNHVVQNFEYKGQNDYGTGF